MNKKWICSLLFCAFLLGVNVNPVVAGLSKGNFIPACKTGSILTESRVKYYQVKKGDTLWDISRAYKVDIDTVMAMNNIDKNTILSIGQTLAIPYSRSRLHIIRKGETMWDIAVKYDVSVEQLMHYNRGKNPRLLKIGDKITIPDSTKRVAAVIREPSRSVTARSALYAWPVIGTITSKYGWRKTGFHHGLDIAGEKGDPIRAAAAGVISFTGYKPVYGKTVIINHPDGRQTLYAHVQSYKIKNGQKVAKGQVIATIGTTGRTTGPHVHFEIKQNDKTMDPLKFLRY